MKYVLSTNQGKAIELGIRNINQAIIFDLLTTLSTWASPEVVDGEVYYWAARQRIADELPLLDLKPDTVYRHLKDLAGVGLIEYRKAGKKDLVRLTEHGRSYVGNESECYVGNESENNSDLNPTDHNYQKTDPERGTHPHARALAPIPNDFKVTNQHRAMAKMMNAPDPEICVDAFIGHHQSKGTVSANWDAEFRKWLAREREYAKMRQHQDGTGQPDLPKQWHETATGIEVKAQELGIAQKDNEPWPFFRDRVLETAGIAR